MANSDSHQVESMAFQCENPFANLERRRDREGSVHVTHTRKATLKWGVTSLKNNIIKPCKGKSTSLRRSYAMHNENELPPRLIPPLMMRRIAVIDIDQGLTLANPSHMKKSIMVNADAKAPFTEDWEMLR